MLYKTMYERERERERNVQNFNFNVSSSEEQGFMKSSVEDSCHHYMVMI